MKHFDVSVFGTGCALVVAALIFFTVRQQVDPSEVVPAPPEGVYSVELEAVVRGQGRTRVRMVLPRSAPGQNLLDESMGSRASAWSLREDASGDRVGVWTGLLSGTTTLRYRARFELDGWEVDLPSPPFELSAPSQVQARYLDPFEVRPQRERFVTQTERLSLPPKDDPAARLRTVQAFVENEVYLEPEGPSEADLALQERFANPLGRARLLTVLAQAASLPARTVTGVRFTELGEAKRGHWVEAWLGTDWVPVHPGGLFFGEKPRDWLAWTVDLANAPGFVTVEGVDAGLVGEQLSARPVMRSARNRVDELTPGTDFFSTISLFSLPLATQSALRFLFLVPLGALLVSVLRVGVGLKTFGGFLPVLLALAFRETSLQAGLMMTVGLIVTGVLGRLALSPLNLLHFPRSSLILTWVVGLVAAATLFGDQMALDHLLVGAFFPVVILALLIERFSLTVEEEGYRSALISSLQTILVIVVTYPVLNSRWVEYVLFAFPEALLMIMGLLVWTGGYTGYRLLDFWRFRFLDSEAVSTSPSEASSFPTSEPSKGSP